MIDNKNILEDQKKLDACVWKDALHCDICGCFPTEDNPICHFTSEPEEFSMAEEGEDPEDGPWQLRSHGIILCRHCYDRIVKTNVALLKIAEKTTDSFHEPDIKRKCSLCGSQKDVHFFRSVAKLLFEDVAREKGYDYMSRYFLICDDCLNDHL